MTPLLEAQSITRSYQTGSETLSVLRQIDLALYEASMTAIVGASGSGKTTLLQLLGTLDKPSSGDLFFRGSSLLGKSAKELASFRNSSLGFIFQFHHLLPDFTAIENVAMPARIAGLNRQEYTQRARRLLDEVELSHRQNHKVAELSGGEQQRAALARALIMEPVLLLADEPTGNLDNRAGDIVFSLLQKLCREKGLTVVMVTHNTTLAEQMDRRLILHDGLLQADR